MSAKNVPVTLAGHDAAECPGTVPVHVPVVSRYSVGNVPVSVPVVTGTRHTHRRCACPGRVPFDPSVNVRCAYYLAHQFHHVRAGAGWRCLECSLESVDAGAVMSVPRRLPNRPPSRPDLVNGPQTPDLDARLERPHTPVSKIAEAI